MEQAELTQTPIKVTPISTSRVHEVDFENVPFGKVFSDHMFSIDFADGRWQNARITPFDNISFAPSISGLHYGQLIFEGMKAFKDINGNPLLFRPEQNMRRFNVSAHRMAMPAVPEQLFRDALYKLVRMDSDWIPPNQGASLYIRPFMFATDEYVGIRPSSTYRFMIFTCPVGPYYSTPVKVKVAEKYVRAIRGGTGYAKAAGNYGGALQPAIEAQKEGYHQLLWLDGCEFKYVHEIGTMNVFFVIGDKVVTPSTDTGEILKGITRDSAITILKDKGYTVEDRVIEIEEVIEASRSGQLKEAFGAGTAATIAHISELGYKGENFVLPPVEERNISNMLKDELISIKRGMTEDKFGWIVQL